MSDTTLVNTIRNTVMSAGLCGFDSLDQPRQLLTEAANRIAALAAENAGFHEHAGRFASIGDMLNAPARVAELEAENARLRAFRDAAYRIAGPRPSKRYGCEPEWSVDLFEVERQAARPSPVTTAREEG